MASDVKRQDAWNSRKRFLQAATGERVAFVGSGESRPSAVFLHGFSDTSRSFSLIERFLPELRFIAPDLPGHGASDMPLGGFKLDYLASMLAEFILGISREPPLIVGHSLGAILAIRLVARRPGIARAAILISPSLRPGGGSRLASWIDELSGPPSPADPFFDYWLETSKPVDSHFLNRVRAEAAALEPAAWRDIFQELRQTDLTEDASLIDCPIVTISGSRDELFDDSHQQLATALLRPIAHFQMEGLGHNPHWEASKRVADLVKKFAELQDLQPVRS